LVCIVTSSNFVSYIITTKLIREESLSEDDNYNDLSDETLDVMDGCLESLKLDVSTG